MHHPALAHFLQVELHCIMKALQLSAFFRQLLAAGVRSLCLPCRDLASESACQMSGCHLVAAYYSLSEQSSRSNFAAAPHNTLSCLAAIASRKVAIYKDFIPGPSRYKGHTVL